MSAVAAVFRRELGGALDSPVAWAGTVLFVVGLHVLFFFLGYPIGDQRLPGFWAGGLASLDALFVWLPPIYAILAPALTMGSWAREFREGTDELLLTQPVTIRALVAGKFAASFALLGAMSLVAILSAALVVASVGPLDWGTVWGGLAGALALAAIHVAVGLLASAVGQEELVAFLLGSIVLLILWAAGLFVRVLPPTWAEALWYASPSLHFLEGGARGLFDLRDVVHAALAVGAALVLNGVVLVGRRWR